MYHVPRARVACRLGGGLVWGGGGGGGGGGRAALSISTLRLWCELASLRQQDADWPLRRLRCALVVCRENVLNETARLLGPRLKGPI